MIPFAHNLDRNGTVGLETVRKAPIGSGLKPQKSTKTGRKSPICPLQRLLQTLFGQFL
jgi:hypothetical protein